MTRSLLLLLGATCLVPLASAGLVLPSAWFAAGPAHWQSEDSPSNHGGLGPTVLCDATVRASAYGPVGRRIGEDIYVGEAIDKYRVHIEAESNDPACPDREWTFDSTYHPSDLIDETFGCEDERCTHVSLFWANKCEGQLRITEGPEPTLLVAVLRDRIGSAPCDLPDGRSGDLHVTA